jgi:molybdopterin-guanine dinucleotide biosynthesis protein A
VPAITDGVLRLLASACVGHAAVPQSGPLPGAYRRSSLPVLARRLHAGDLALCAAADELDTRIVQIDPSLLVNVNRLEDMPLVLPR